MTTTISTPTKLWHEQNADPVCADFEIDPVRLKFFDPFKNVLVMVLLAAVDDIGHARGFIGSIIMNTRFAALLLTQFLSVSSTVWINNKMAFL